MTIKHLIISGGGIHGFTFWGMIKECMKHNVIVYDNIETITSTSIGSFIAVIISLNYDTSVIDEYIIKRPWHETIPLGVYEYLEAFNKCGIFDTSLIKTIMKPLFGGKNISLDITLKEFYEFSNIECNFLCTNAFNLQPVLMNHKNFPDEKLLDVVYCSASIPIIFQPIEIQNIHYIDGGINANYPIDFFIDNYENVNTDEILGINNNLLVDSKIDYTNLISYVSSSLFIMINNRVSRHINAKIKFEISFHPSVEDTFDFSKMIYNESERNRSIHKGTLLAENLIILYNGNNLGDDTSIGTTDDTDRPNDTNEKETIPY
jgi:NTE family protein